LSELVSGRGRSSCGKIQGIRHQNAGLGRRGEAFFNDLAAFFFDVSLARGTTELQTLSNATG
jgi:hypothetical protein